ncbi:MAG: septal ring lytic transglycosylase RlpA family protein [Rudaea sp.]
MMWIGARVLIALALLTLCGCFNRHQIHHDVPRKPAARNIPEPNAGRYAQSQDSTPTQIPDVSKIPEPVPKLEPRSRYGNKSPYTVLGKTYRVLPTCEDYDERGLASWYGNKFHGYTTSNLERYDMYAYSAANKTLPLPCYVRVTNLDNGRSVVVRVNDRGPFVSDRIIDLSYVAAIKLGVWPKGTAHVEVQGIDPKHLRAPREPERQRAVTASPEIAHNSRVYLQVGAYADVHNAQRAAIRVRLAQLGGVDVVQSRINGRMLYRVRVGPLENRADAERLMPKLRALGLGTPQIAVDN